MFSEFVGVDGCRAGWIAVNLAPTGELSHEVDGDIGPCWPGIQMRSC